MKKLFLILILSFLAFLKAFAQSGEEILDKVEKALSGPKDYEAKATMILANLDNTGREQREIKIWFAGKNKSLIKFISPPGVEGIGLLSNEEGMSLYLPAQNKIRLIEGNLKDEDFQGTDFSYNEIGSFDYKLDYNSEVLAQDEKFWTLSLKRKPSSQRLYDKAIMIVDKKTAIPQKIELYTGQTLKKVLYILEISQNSKYLIPVKIRVENLVKRHYTEMRLSEIKFDQDLEKKGVFTKRFLKKAVK